MVALAALASMTFVGASLIGRDASERGEPVTPVGVVQLPRERVPAVVLPSPSGGVASSLAAKEPSGVVPKAAPTARPGPTDLAVAGVSFAAPSDAGGRVRKAAGGETKGAPKKNGTKPGQGGASPAPGTNGGGHEWASGDGDDENDGRARGHHKGKPSGPPGWNKNHAGDGAAPTGSNEQDRPKASPPAKAKPAEQQAAGQPSGNGKGHSEGKDRGKGKGR